MIRAATPSADCEFVRAAIVILPAWVPPATTMLSPAATDASNRGTQQP